MEIKRGSVDLTAIIRYENEELDDNETLALFSELIKSGLAWRLQGHYGRQAHALIDNGLIMANGEVDWDYVNALERGY